MQAAGTLVVAPDEKHVAFLRDARTFDAGCVARGLSRSAGTLVVLDLQSDGSACERVVADNVDATSIYFSGDSRGLVFANDVDDCGVGKLKTADADGSNVRQVYGSAKVDVAIGSTVFFGAGNEAGNEDRYLAAQIAGGKTVSLGTRSDLFQNLFLSNATGTAFAYMRTRYRAGNEDIAEFALILVELPSGESHTLVDGVSNQSGSFAWSPRGDWLAFCYGPRGMPITSLALVAADGSSRAEVSTNCDCLSYTFSPDSAWLAYGEPDGSGGTRLSTYSLEDGRSVPLGALPQGYSSISFSDDGASVVAAVETTSMHTSVHAAATGVASSLQFLVDVSGGSYDLASSGGYVAVPVDNTKVEVYPVSGGVPVTLVGSKPRFEPGVSQPHLLLLQYPPNALVIAAPDGSTATTHVVPSDYFLFASWLGSAAVYGTVPDSSEPVTISALTNAGAVSTLLASEAGAYAWAPIAAPTRLFYSRAVASAEGTVGVFSVDLPR
jgi:hypothetical protein